MKYNVISITIRQINYLSSVTVMALINFYQFQTHTPHIKSNVKMHIVSIEWIFFFVSLLFFDETENEMLFYCLVFLIKLSDTRSFVQVIKKKKTNFFCDKFSLSTHTNDSEKQNNINDKNKIFYNNYRYAVPIRPRQSVDRTTKYYVDILDLWDCTTVFVSNLLENYVYCICIHNSYAFIYALETGLTSPLLFYVLLLFNICQ